MGNSCSKTECLPNVTVVLLSGAISERTEKKEGYQCKYTAMHYLNKLWVGKEYLFLFCVHKCDFTPLDISLWFHLSHFFFFFAMRTVCLHWTDKYDFFLSMSTISATILCFKNAVNLKMSNAFKCWLMVHWSKLKRGYLRLSSGQL